MGESKTDNMKKILVSMMFSFAAIAFVNISKAQVNVGVHINIGDQPEWGPTGYDYAEYYYLPDIEAYYYVPRHQFVYLSGNRWIFSSSLPHRHAHYDLYSGYKVVLRTPHAYHHFRDHRVRYARYKHHQHKQVTIKHKHVKWKNKDKGNGKGHGKGRH